MLARLLTSAFGLMLLTTSGLAGDEWRAVDPAELAIKTPVVEKDADAEALFWEVQIDDRGSDEMVFSNYVRVKIFTERGKESQGKIDLEYLRGTKIKDIAARTIKPDGTIVELDKDDVHERTIVKASGLKAKAKSFALPGIEPGCIIEYRWREVFVSYTLANYLKLPFQLSIPARSVTYLVRPYTGPRAGSMRYASFQVAGGVKFEKAKSGFYQVSLANVPAYHEEPRMPPEDSVRSWILLHYSANTSTDPEKYWSDYGKRLYERTEDEMKVNDDVRSAAAEIIKDANTPQEKLLRIYEYCQTKIKNARHETSGLSSDEREKFKANKSPAETLKRGIGTGANIDQAFVALAVAAGFEARLALSGNRQHFFLDRRFTDPYFLRHGSAFVAVRVGESWQFFHPSEPYTPFGMLDWREEGQGALIVDKEPSWVTTPVSPPEKSLQKRSGRFRLLEDGTLEGDVHIEYTGQLAIDEKEFNEDESPAQREKTLTEGVKARMSTAELSDIKIENVTDPVKPFLRAYHIRVPGYAQRTGKRLFLQPGFFAHGTASLFAANERKNDVYFHYPWSEQDEISIELPAGFALDNAETPAPITPQMTQNLCENSINMAISKDNRTLIYKRSFFFGGGGMLLFPARSYAGIKKLFDVIHQRDDHTITLKQTMTASSPKQ